MQALQLKVDPATRGNLDKQAEEIGLPTANIWAASILKTVSELPAAAALKLMGRATELKRSPRGRDSDL